MEELKYENKVDGAKDKNRSKSIKGTPSPHL